MSLDPEAFRRSTRIQSGICSLCPDAQACTTTGHCRLAAGEIRRPEKPSAFIQTLLAVILDHGYDVHLLPGPEFGGGIVMRVNHIPRDRLNRTWTQHGIAGLEMSEATVGVDVVLADVLGFLDEELTARLRATPVAE